MRGLAFRRHHRWRLYRRRKDYYNGWGSDSPRVRGLVYNTPKPCSCPGCSRNWERRNMGHVTRQEKKAEMQMQEEIRDAGL
jgi:hypothetical protein